MSSQQATLDGFRTDTPDKPEAAPEPEVSNPKPTETVDGIPNFNRERGEERTKLGADLSDLCAQARENEPSDRPRRALLDSPGGGVN